MARNRRHSVVLVRTSNCREGTLGGLTSFVPVDDVREGDQMRAEMTSLFIGTNDVTPRSVPSLQFEVLALFRRIGGRMFYFCQFFAMHTFATVME